MFTCTRNENLSRLAKAVRDFDCAESMVFTVKHDHILDGTNTVNSYLPPDFPSELLAQTAKALTDAFGPARKALKYRALIEMESAVAALRKETA